MNMLAHPQHILVVKPDALGDFVLATPALRVLRLRHPSSSITLVTGARCSGLARWCPDVDQVLQVPLFTHSAISDAVVAETADHLRFFLCSQKTAPDLGIVLRWDVDLYGAGALLFRAGVPERIGYGEKCTLQKSILNQGYDQFYTRPVLDTAVEHEVIKNSRLVGAAPEDLSIPLQLDRYETIAAKRSAEEIMAKLTLSPGFIALGIGSSLPIKTFDFGRWESLVNLVKQHLDAPVCLFGGGASDERLASALVEATGCISAVGLLKENEIYSLIKHAKLAICADSFIKHVAAAARIPTIELSSHTQGGNVNSEFGGLRFGAWGNNSMIIKPENPRPGCHPDRCVANEPHCILDIDLSRVLDAARRLVSVS